MDHVAPQEYATRLARHAEERDALARSDSRLADVRLYVVIAAGVAAWLAFGRHWFTPWALLAFGIAFAALMVRHERVAARLALARRRVAFYEAGVARLEDRWRGKGIPGTRFLDPKHPYAIDLDLFGEGSLFELLCVARTRAGEDRLASWLMTPAAPDIVRARQAAVRELAPRLDLREELALLGEDVRGGLQPAALVAWGAEPPAPHGRGVRLAAFGLAALTLASLAAWGWGAGLVPFLAVVALARAFDWRQRSTVRRVRRTLSGPARDLKLLSLMLARLERETFESPLLCGLRARLHGGREGGEPASARIARLDTLAGSLEAVNNPLLALPAALVLWATQFSLAVEAWRAENGPSLAQWLDAVGEFEALSALAAYAYEHPADPFPALLESGAHFEAVGLAHPLLPSALAVPNDLTLDRSDAALLIVSGSNMSGKSTLLRAVGVAAVLAQAGAPVRAQSLRLSPLAIGASLRTQDSLQGGISRFYAEILRLRQIVEIGDGEAPPLLFLIDEILHGTNSHDRHQGTEAVARALVRRGAVGLITTHDLALAALTDDTALAAANVHFEDQMTGGRMTFDYRLRTGVVTQSNAIALMRAVGLEV
jgi:hypothetical protein